MKDGVIKRIGDIVGSVSLMVVMSPILLVAAMLVACDGTGGEIVLKEPRRVGKLGIPFRIYKFRTMVPYADRKMQHDLRYNECVEKLKKKRKLSLSEDPRLTSSGRWLRRFDIDELPQLFNVLEGTMSLVGPRPYLPEEVEIVSKSMRDGKAMMKRIWSVLPGISGVWQVSGRNDIDLERRVALEAAYASSRSLWGDFTILLKTPWVVLTRKGAW